MRADTTFITDLDIGADDRVGADLDTIADTRIRMDDGCGMNHLRLLRAHISSASAATSPSTFATP